MTINEQVLALDLENLTPEESEWLHDLKNIIQRVNGCIYMKSIGKTGWKK